MAMTLKTNTQRLVQNPAGSPQSIFVFLYLCSVVVNKSRSLAVYRVYQWKSFWDNFFHLYEWILYFSGTKGCWNSPLSNDTKKFHFCSVIVTIFDFLYCTLIRNHNWKFPTCQLLGQSRSSRARKRKGPRGRISLEKIVFVIASSIFRLQRANTTQNNERDELYSILTFGAIFNTFW